jgi:hypothetical protein
LIHTVFGIPARVVRLPSSGLAQLLLGPAAMPSAS